MVRPLGALLIFIVTVSAVSVSAQKFDELVVAQSACQRMLLPPPVQSDLVPLAVIPRESEAPKPFEISSTGFLATDASSLSQLPDGKYMFLVARLTSEAGTRELLVYTPEFPFDDPALNPSAFGEEGTPNFFASHHSLHNLIKSLARTWKLTEPAIEVVGSGEFDILGGLAVEIYGRSGRFRGSKEHLDYSARLLKRYGLPIVDMTYILAYEERPKPPHRHASDNLAGMVQLAKRRWLLVHDEQARSDAQFLSRLYRALAHCFPGSIQMRESLGQGSNTMIDYLTLFLGSARRSASEEEANALSQLMQTFRQAESLELETAIYNRYSDRAAQIQNQSPGDKLSPTFTELGQQALNVWTRIDEKRCLATFF